MLSVLEGPYMVSQGLRDSSTQSDISTRSTPASSASKVATFGYPRKALPIDLGFSLLGGYAVRRSRWGVAELVPLEAGPHLCIKVVLAVLSACMMLCALSTRGGTRGRVLAVLGTQLGIARREYKQVMSASLSKQVTAG